MASSVNTVLGGCRPGPVTDRPAGLDSAAAGDVRRPAYCSVITGMTSHIKRHHESFHKNKMSFPLYFK
jgi:hypothetical protein